MHRSFPNVVPVANKYLGHKDFLKTQAEHQNNVRVHFHILLKYMFSCQIKNARGVIDRTEPTPRPHCTQRLRQKQVDYSIDFYNFY
jgi:hypothetical protein